MINWLIHCRINVMIETSAQLFPLSFFSAVSPSLKSYQIRGWNRDSSAVQAGDESSRTTLWFPLTIVVTFFLMMMMIYGLWSSECPIATTTHIILTTTEIKKTIKERTKITVNAFKSSSTALAAMFDDDHCSLCSNECPCCHDTYYTDNNRNQKNDQRKNNNNNHSSLNFSLTST